MILLDSNVLLDIWDPDPVWHEWSSSQMRNLSPLHEFAINPIIYAEISVSFTSTDALDERLLALGVSVMGIPRKVSLLAGKAHAHYRRKGGLKGTVLADYFIGAHAAVLGCAILTRDTRRYQTYFPTVPLIAP